MNLRPLFLTGMLAIASIQASTLGSIAAMANSGAWSGDDVSSVRLVSAASAVGSDTAIRFGLEFKLQPGWKIYWRTPGDAGLPPIPDWSASQNVSDITMSWPLPERFDIFDIGTLGYKDSVVFPLSVAPERPGETLRVAGAIDYLICSEICIPGHAEVALTLSPGAADITEEAHLIDRFRAAVPTTDPAVSGMQVTRSMAETTADGTVQLALAVTSSGAPFSTPDAFIEGTGGAYFDRPTVMLSDDRGTATLQFTAPVGIDLATLTRDGITATLIDGDRTLEARLMPVQGSLRDTDVAADTSLWPVLALALLGGLILNLMPCVLPVLSLKLISVIAKSGKESRIIRAGFLASSAGIITSFLLLAGAAIAVRQAGLSVGWGIQFQQPVFLAGMIALLTLFACNLVGLFEFRLPGLLSDRAAVAGNDRDGLLRDFLTGGFATLLATPCSAPFLGTAVGFALGAGPGEIVAVFLALGLGLALPYLLIAAFPQLVRFLPRPGRWILYLKVILALALVGTALWLLSILRNTLGLDNALAMGALAAVAAAVLASRKIDGSRLGRAAWPVSAMLAVALVLSPLVMQAQPKMSQPQGKVDTAGISWQIFDEARIPELVSQGKTVLVDVTADWCVTCQWNKKTVLQVDPISVWLGSPSVVAMQADWTLPDPVISDFLKRHGRYGIPFNIVYGPAAPGGVALPELLTTDAVRSAATAADPETTLANR